MRTFAMIALIAVGFLTPGKTWAQAAETTFVPEYARAAITGTTLPEANGIQQVECSSCGTMRAPAFSMSGCSSCGGGAGTMCSDGCQSGLCKPGRNCKFTGNCGNGFFDSFFGGLGECLCCSDPCYEPVWNTTANSAFFQDTVRPKTYTRFGYHYRSHMTAPRIAEYYMGKGSNVGTANTQELTMYQEVASDKAAFFIEMPYRALDWNDGSHNAGFVDLNLGTKSMLLDCELLQMTFQFKTFIPTGNAGGGTGTGHVSLEPALLFSLKLFDATYLQSEYAYFIPIAGDKDWSGSVFHYHFSLNHMFAERGPWQVIGTAEFNGWHFTDGLAFTTGDLAPVDVRAGDKSYYTAGPGLRIVYCENYDLGLGYACALSDGYLGQNQYRAELRIRY